MAWPQAATTPDRRRLLRGLTSVEGKEADRGLPRRIDGVHERVGVAEQQG